MSFNININEEEKDSIRDKRNKLIKEGFSEPVYPNGHYDPEDFECRAIKNAADLDRAMAIYCLTVSSLPDLPPKNPNSIDDRVERLMVRFELIIDKYLKMVRFEMIVDKFLEFLEMLPF